MDGMMVLKWQRKAFNCLQRFTAMKRCRPKHYNFQIINDMSKENKTSDNPQNGNDFIADVGGSIPPQSELVAETADAYCPNCEAYIVNERVTYDECCDNCGTYIEWHE